MRTILFTLPLLASCIDPDDSPELAVVEAAIQPINAEMSLRTYQWEYLRTQPNGAVYFAQIDGMTENDTTDTWFRKVPGRSDSSCVSFESVRYPGHFIRHNGPNVAVVAGTFWDYSFNNDTTFCPDGYSYEAFNGPGWYLVRSGNTLVLSQDYYNRALFEEPPATIGWWSNVAGGSVTATSIVWESRGWCTGITPPGQQPRYSCTMSGIYMANAAPWANPTQFRPLIYCSVSLPYIGTQPWIRVSRRLDSLTDHKIERGIDICF